MTTEAEMVMSLLQEHSKELTGITLRLKSLADATVALTQVCDQQQDMIGTLKDELLSVKSFLETDTKEVH